MKNQGLLHNSAVAFRTQIGNRVVPVNRIFSLYLITLGSIESFDLSNLSCLISEVDYIQKYYFTLNCGIITNFHNLVKSRKICLQNWYLSVPIFSPEFSCFLQDFFLYASHCHTKYRHVFYKTPTSTIQLLRY